MKITKYITELKMKKGNCWSNRVLIALAICCSLVPGSAWSSFLGPALSRPTRKATRPSSLKQHERPLSLVMKADDGSKKDGDSSFSLSNIFGGKGSSGATTATAPNLRGRNKALEPHPSVRKHISPLNRLGPDFDKSQLGESDALPMHPEVKAGTLPNGFSYVILPNKSPPGRFEAHLQVFSGSGTWRSVFKYQISRRLHISTYSVCFYCDSLTL